jgi:hypothetical protein
MADRRVAGDGQAYHSSARLELPDTPLRRNKGQRDGGAFGKGRYADSF